MNTALLYRPHQRWLFWMALACAATIHLGAVVFAKGKADKVVVQGFTPPGFDVEVVDSAPDQKPPEESATPQEQFVPDEKAFPEENRAPALDRPHRKMRATSVLRGTRASFGSVKTLVIYAPRPVYPYEARSQRIIGSGIALLSIDPVVGNVTGIRMTQTCGNVILDNATLGALRRWRFKPGSALSVEVPITYTLTGASY